MISVTEARKILNDNRPPRKSEWVELRKAAGRILAKAVTSPSTVPPFNNSAMDGYAFEFASWQGRPLQVIGETAAGHPSEHFLKSGQAMRIFTGAPVPAGADTVVMQEKVKLENGVLLIEDDKLSKGSNVRLAGSQNSVGDTLLKAHTNLSAGAMGFLAGCGVAKVEVFVPPRVTILVTGDEIVPPGSILQPGQVFECNSFSLTGALAAFNIIPEVHHCRDSQENIREAIKNALTRSDLLLITGGVSVGDYDFVVPSLEENGVERLFHRIKQKPAKPLYAGKKDTVSVFGLPGNPASVLTSFYVYVAPLVRYLTGLDEITASAHLATSYSRKPGLTQFLKGFVLEGIVNILEGQESYRMDGFANANCLIEVPEEISELEKGSTVRIIPF